jgi:hypothetical protein
VNQGRDVHYQRNTFVRPAPQPYSRPPYVHGGHRYYAHHHYDYHPYRPHYWGAGFYPFGAFFTSLAASAILIDIADTQYQYAQGVWYAPVEGGYDVVTAPVGAVVPGLPSDAEQVAQDVYYYGGAYYQQNADGSFTVVTPWAGLVVSQLPPGGEEITIGDQSYVRFGATYYQPIVQDGQYMYEVVEVR